MLPLALAGVLNMTSGITHWSGWTVHSGLLACVLMELVCIQWCFSVRRRFPQKHMRSNVTKYAAMVMLLLVLRAAKYSFVDPDGAAARCLWYAYYVPLTFTPLFAMHAALYFGKPDDYVIGKKWRWTYLPPVLLSAGVLTNDLHRLAFRFPQGLGRWEADYTYGVLYVLTVCWIVFAVLFVVAVTARFSLNQRLIKKAWLPAAVFCGGVAYNLLNLFGVPFLLRKMFNLPDFMCIAGIAMWESLVAARIIVSNSEYPAIFAVSSLNAGLADRDFRVRQASVNAPSPPPETLREATGGEVPLPDGDTVLKLRQVQGGWFYWTEDVTALRRLNAALAETADALAEENAVMQLSAQMDENRRATAAQACLYDSVTASLRPQLDTLHDWLSGEPAPEADYRAMLQRCSVLLAYCKRRSNLLLQAEAHPALSGEDLRLCFEESANALRLSGIPCGIAAEEGVRLTARSAAALYEAFETALELALPALAFAEVSLTRAGESEAAVFLTLGVYKEKLAGTGLSPARLSETACGGNGAFKAVFSYVTEGGALCD